MCRLPLSEIPGGVSTYEFYMSNSFSLVSDGGNP